VLESKIKNQGESQIQIAVPVGVNPLS